MKLSATLARRLPWLNLPGALLLGLLQRTPVAPVAARAIVEAGAAPAGAIVRAVIATVASLGAVHALAGATQVVVTQGSSPTPINAVNATVGTAITPLTFVTSFSAGGLTVGSYVIKNLPPGLTVAGLIPATGILNITNTTGAGQITGTPTTAGNYTATIQAWEFSNANPTGSSTPVLSILFTIASNLESKPPSITTQPADTVTAIGETAIFTVGVSANPPVTQYQWKKNGLPIAGATSASLSLSNVSILDAGSYAVDVTNSFGTVSSGAATLTVNAASSPPVFLVQPVSQTVVAGATVVLSAIVNGAPPPTYQWLRNGAKIDGATSAMLVLTGANVVAANYTVTATNFSNGSVLTTVTSEIARLIVLPTNNPGHLKNLSVLTHVTATDPSFTVATVIGPASATGTKPLLVRAAGPSLGQFGIADSLPDPKLVMFQSSSTFASNNDWSNESGLGAVFTRVGAFSFTSASSLDAAHYSEATPAGSYSVQVSGAAGQSGSVLAEIYDATAASALTATAPRLINVSVLKTIAAGDLVSAGFVIEGDTSLTVLLRAVGPGLSAVKVTTGVLVDPKIELFDHNSVSIARNDNWGGDSALVATAKAVGAFALPDTGSKDAVLLITLPPGLYSAQASGTGPLGGLAIVEIYEVR